MSSKMQGSVQRRLEIKEKVLDDIYFGVVLLVLPLVLVSWFRFQDLERMDLFYLTAGVPIILSVIYFLRSKISYIIRSWIIIVTIYLAGVLAYLQISIVSIGLPLLFASTIMATMLLSRKLSKIVATINGLTLLAISLLVINHLISFDFEASDVLYSFESWSIQLLGFIVIVFTLVLGIRRINTFNEDFSKELEIKNHEIQQNLAKIKRMDSKLSFNEAQLTSTRKEANNNEALYKTLFNNMNDLVYAIDLEGRFEVVNDNFLKTFKTNEDQVYGKSLYEIIGSKSTDSQWESLIQRVIDIGESESMFNTFEDQEGKVHTYEVTIMPIYIDGKVKKLMGTSKDVTAFLNQEETIRRLAFKDPLTSLNNRLAFKDYITSKIHNYTIGTYPFAICLIDVDEFKKINETIGYVKGDEMIKLIASRINNLNSNSEFVSRISGDAFALVLTLENLDQDLDRFIDTIKASMKEGFILGDKHFDVSVSSGMTIYPYEGKTYEELFSNADKALFEAKHLGKNNHLLFKNII